MSLLSLSGLGVELGHRPVLGDVSLTIKAGEFVGLIGPNGAGKSTLLRAALGLVPMRGHVGIGERDAARLTARDRARLLAYVPQERDTAWRMSVEVLVGLGRLPHIGAFAAPSARDRLAVEHAMRDVDVLHLRDRPVTELSGGEKARVLVARALAQQAPMLLADEPAAGLDPSHQIGLMRLFHRLASEGRGVLATIHDLGLAARWCSRVILLDAGRVVADGPPAMVLTAETIRAAYGVTAYVEETEDGIIVQPLDLADRPQVSE